MSTYHVYGVINATTHDAYVGCTSRIETRWTEHKRRLTLGKHSSPRLQAAWNAHGAEAFRFVILAILVDAAYSTAKRAEIAWIAKVGTYNETGADPQREKFVFSEDRLISLGDRNRARSQTPEMRANMAEHTARRWADPEQRKTLMNAPKRGKHHVKGMASVKTPEQWVEHSAKLKAAWADPEKRKKLKERQEARWKDPEARARHAEKMRAYHARRRALLAQ